MHAHAVNKISISKEIIKICANYQNSFSTFYEVDWIISGGNYPDSRQKVSIRNVPWNWCGIL